MANAVYKGSQVSGRAIHATADCGNAWTDDTKVTITANLVTTDAVQLLYIPAGVKLTSLRYRSGDCDTGTTLAVNLGYRSMHATPLLTAAPSYFMAAATVFQAAVAGWTELVFEPVTFSEPVVIELVPTTNATGLSGTPSIWMEAMGAVVGTV